MITIENQRISCKFMTVCGRAEHRPESIADFGPSMRCCWSCLVLQFHGVSEYLDIFWYGKKTKTNHRISWLKHPQTHVLAAIAPGSRAFPLGTSEAAKVLGDNSRLRGWIYEIWESPPPDTATQTTQLRHRLPWRLKLTKYPGFGCHPKSHGLWMFIQYSFSLPVTMIYYSI